MNTRPLASARPAVRPAEVAGSFYPADARRLAALVERILAGAVGPDAEGGSASRLARPGLLAGLLVPHAGLAYSGVVAAAGWRRVATAWPDAPVTVVLLGTNHGAPWLDGVAGWGAGAWQTPLGDVAVDDELAEAIVGLGPPFLLDRAAHLGEHSIEVHLPLLQVVAPRARIVPLTVSAGTGSEAIVAGARLGRLLAARRAMGHSVLLGISSDMAHYPPARACDRVTEELLPAILRLDAAGLARREAVLVEGDIPGLVCGMCGIEPAVLGLAALRAIGIGPGAPLAAATSADAGGPPDRTVGYLSVAWTT